MGWVVSLYASRVLIFHKGGGDVHTSCLNIRVLLSLEGRGEARRRKKMYSKWVTSIVLGERRIVGKVSTKTREVI